MADRDDRVWERGWDEHAEAQRTRLADLPLAEKIAWLEQAQVMLGHLRMPRAAARDPLPSSGGGTSPRADRGPVPGD